jgi:membrane protein
MAAALGRLFTLVRETVPRWSEDRASTLAAALAYYALFSFAPLLLLAVAVAGLVFGERAAEGQLYAQLAGVVGSASATALQRLVANLHQHRSGGIVATVVGIGALLFAASGVFTQLQGSMNAIWRAKRQTSTGVLKLLWQRLLSFGMVMGIGLLLLLSLIISTVLSTVGGYLGELLPGGTPVSQALDVMAGLVVMTGLFAMIYKFLPDTKVAWGDVWVGALVTAILFSVGKIAIGFYLARAGVASGYGAAGSLVVLLLWIYYSALILFFGAEFTYVYASHRGRH